MPTDATSVAIVSGFVLFAGVVTYIIRPHSRRQSRRPARQRIHRSHLLSNDADPGNLAD